MERKKSLYERFFKRILDIITALAVLIAFFWLYIIIAVMVRVKMGSPVLFAQDRPGKDEKVFKLYKFRTMTDERDQNGELLPDEMRLKKFGRWLRATSLDELPEMINILRGDMSLVGPRPLAVDYIPYYSEKERHRHDVRAGLTGLAQVNGRSFISWEEIFEYDVQYVNNITLWGDFKIIFQTFLKVIFHENVADVTEATMDEEGRLHFEVNGIDYILHQPLNVERKSICKER